MTWSTDTVKPLRLISEPTNGGEESIRQQEPYVVSVGLHGMSDMLFHRWNNESVAEKAAAAKNSAIKKTDNIESYVWRNDEGNICLPGEYLRGSIIMAAKFRQDPRSPRKSAMDLYKAGIVSLTNLAPIMSNGATTPSNVWDYEDKRRVMVQRSGITRTRPAFRSGWKATIELMVNLPEYITPNDLRDVISSSGRLIGLADFRPTYGRFALDTFNPV